MADRTEVDLGVLEHIAARLTGAGTDLAATGRQLPGSVDAGEATSQIAAVISNLMTSVGDLAAALTETGSRVNTARTRYAQADREGQQGFEDLAGLF